MQEVHKDHPLIKFNSNQDMEKFAAQIQSIYTGDYDSSSDEEEEKIDVNASFTPKIIDSSAEPPAPKEKFVPKTFCANYKCAFVSSMPKTDYTIDESQASIHLTLTVKNSGGLEWPSAFMVCLLDVSCNTHQVEKSKDELFRSRPVEKIVKSDSEIEIEVILQNPEVEGEYQYLLSMCTLDSVPFGDMFKFKLNVKGGTRM